MKKSERIESEVGGPHAGSLESHPCYLGWFQHFNEGRYYEAHDVLEHLWLRTSGKNYAFFKGLIQLAGAFVHLKLHRENPGHPKHAGRLKPAVRLFQLARKNLVSYRPQHLGLAVENVLALTEQWETSIARGEFAWNPWTPEAAPTIVLIAP